MVDSHSLTPFPSVAEDPTCARSIKIRITVTVNIINLISFVIKTKIILIPGIRELELFKPYVITHIYVDALLVIFIRVVIYFIEAVVVQVRQDIALPVWTIAKQGVAFLCLERLVPVVEYQVSFIALYHDVGIPVHVEVNERRQSVCTVRNFQIGVEYRAQFLIMPHAVMYIKAVFVYHVQHTVTIHVPKMVGLGISESRSFATLE